MTPAGTTAAAAAVEATTETAQAMPARLLFELALYAVLALAAGSFVPATGPATRVAGVLALALVGALLIGRRSPAGAGGIVAIAVAHLVAASEALTWTIDVGRPVAPGVALILVVGAGWAVTRVRQVDRSLTITLCAVAVVLLCWQLTTAWIADTQRLIDLRASTVQVAHWMLLVILAGGTARLVADDVRVARRITVATFFAFAVGLAMTVSGLQLLNLFAHAQAIW